MLFAHFDALHQQFCNGKMENGKIGMAKGEWVKGKGVRPVVRRCAGACGPALCCKSASVVRMFLLIGVVARIVETAGDRVCSARVLRVSAILYRLIA